MSERAVGYTTVGGDNQGGYSLIGNLPKTVDIALLQYIKDEYGIKCVKDVLDIKASAELAEDQEDEKDLMPFDILDACIKLFFEDKMMPVEVYKVVRTMWADNELDNLYTGYKLGMLKDWVKRFFMLYRCSIFKWVQAPQGVHLGAIDLDRERALQLPVVQSREWLEASLKEIDDCP